jgi:hypothetical protein
MSKLIKFKKWLTIEDAASYLSTKLNEPINACDLLQLGLDGFLTISVNLLNAMYVRCGKAIPNTGNISGGFPFNGKDLLVFDSRIEMITGIYDLPMIAGEIQDCNHKIQKIAGGPLVGGGDPRGAFLKSPTSESYYQRMDYIEQTDKQNGYFANRHKPELWDWTPRLFDDVNLEHYVEQGGVLLAVPSRQDVFVIRTDALFQFEQSQTRVSEAVEKPLSTRERDNLLKTIGGMLALMLDKRPETVKAKTRNQSEIILALVAAYGDKDGISERKLQERFAEGNRLLTTD